MLYGLQKRFDKNGDGKLKGAEWQRWYQYAYGDEIEAKEKRRRANTAEQKRAQIAADFADHVSDLINWIYRDLAHLEGEREDQAIRTMHLALYVISAALQTQKVDESMRYLLRAFWNEFQPTFDESVYQALCAKQVMFAEIGEISEKRLGSFWRNLLDNLPPERRVGKDDDLQELLTIQTVFITISAMTAHRKLILPRSLSHIGQRSACRKNRKNQRKMTKMRNRRKNPNLGQIFMRNLHLRRNLQAADITSSVRCSSRTAEVHTPI